MRRTFWIWLLLIAGLVAWARLISMAHQEPTVAVEHDGTIRIELVRTDTTLYLHPMDARDGAKQAYAELRSVLGQRNVLFSHRDVSYKSPVATLQNRDGQPLPHLAITLDRNSAWIHSWASAHGIMTVDFSEMAPYSTDSCGPLALHWRLAAETQKELVRRHLLPDRRAIVVEMTSPAWAEYTWGKYGRPKTGRRVGSYGWVGWDPGPGDLVIGPHSDPNQSWQKSSFAESYSLVRHYLSAVAATGTTRPDKVLAHMKATPVPNTYGGPGRLRDDGQLLTEQHIFRNEADGWSRVRTLTMQQVDQAAPNVTRHCASFAAHQ